MKIRDDILVSQASRVLKNNIFHGQKDSGYTAASGQTLLPGENKPRFLYPFQWLWDTFFIAGWSQDIDQSITDVNKFLASQRPDGLLGHIRYNREILDRKEYFPPPQIYYPEGLPQTGEIISKITQPPNVAYGIWELVKKITDEEKRLSLLKTVFPKILLYHQYLYDNLVYNGLLVTIHPWQAGDDNSPKWDEIYRRIPTNHADITAWLAQMGLAYERVDTRIVHHTQRPIDTDYDIYLYLIMLYGRWRWDPHYILKHSPFLVADPLTNSILLRSNICLLEMARSLKQTQDILKIEQWIAESENGLASLWDDQADFYHAKDLQTGKFIKVDTVSSLMPLFTRAIPESQSALLANRIREINGKYPHLALVPSTFPDQKEFEPRRYWRGPVWIIINILLADGLRFYGYFDLAQKIISDSQKILTNSLDNRGGFYEYFDPVTGDGLGSPLQSWTAAAVIHMQTLTH